jgi:hypothetical protein
MAMIAKHCCFLHSAADTACAVNLLLAVCWSAAAGVRPAAVDHRGPHQHRSRILPSLRHGRQRPLRHCSWLPQRPTRAPCAAACSIPSRQLATAARGGQSLWRGHCCCWAEGPGGVQQETGALADVWGGDAGGWAVGWPVVASCSSTVRVICMCPSSAGAF